MKDLSKVPFKPYYEKDGIVIYNADCRQVLPFLPKFDLLLTDPPYGYGWKTDYSRFLRGSVNKKEVAQDDERPEIEPFIKIAKESIVFGANSICILEPGSFLIWDKRCADGFSFLSDGEAAWWSRGNGVYIKSINAQKFRSKKGGLHPTQKPVELFAWCIKKAKENNTIADPFMGSGTTLVAAKQEGKKAVGIELEERYCEVAANRLAQNVLF